jgi:hypothetical protein
MCPFVRRTDETQVSMYVSDLFLYGIPAGKFLTYLMHRLFLKRLPPEVRGD